MDKENICETITYNSLHINKDGRIVYYDCSQCEPDKQDMLYCMAFHKNVDITVITNEGIHHTITGEVSKALLMGEEFTLASQNMKRYDMQSELSAIWIINPQDERINFA